MNDVTLLVLRIKHCYCKLIDPLPKGSDTDPQMRKQRDNAVIQDF